MTMQATIDTASLHNLELAYERLAAESKANSTKLDSLVETQARIIETQNQIMLVLTRMDERMNAMNDRQDATDTRVDRLETKLDELGAKLDRLMYWVIGLLTTLSLAALGIAARFLFFPV